MSNYMLVTPNKRHTFTKLLLVFNHWPTPVWKPELTDRVSYVLQQDKIRLVLTSPLNKGGDLNQRSYCNEHGDAAKVIALWVDDATKAYEETTSRGAQVLYGAYQG